MGLFSKSKAWEDRGISLSSDQLRDTLSNFTGMVLLRDSKYRAIPYKDFEVLLTYHRQEEPKYRDNIWDCDESAIAFVADVKRGWAEKSFGNEALACGYAQGKLENGIVHAWAWMVTDELSVVFIEPQTNKRMKGQPSGVSIIEG